MPIFGSLAGSGLASKLLHAVGAAFKLFVSKASYGGGGIYRSTDGTSWSDSGTGFAGTKGWAYGNGILAATDANLSAYVSRDAGATWETVDLPGNYDAYNISFVDGYFYIDTSAIYRSTDLITWQTTTPAISYASGASNSKAVKAGGKIHIPVAYNSFMNSSTDGVTWTTATELGPRMPVGGGPIQGFTFFNSNFQAWAQNDIGNIYRSTDMVTWSSTALPGTATYPKGSDNGALVVANGRLFALPSNMSYGADNIRSSTNGTTWTSMSIPNNYNPASRIVYGNSRWAGLIDYSYMDMTTYISTSYTYVMNSTTGTSFSLSTRVDKGGAIAYGNGSDGQPLAPGWAHLLYGTKFLMVGTYSENMFQYTCLLSSTDSITWNSFTKLTANSGNYTNMEYGNSLWVGFNAYASGGTNAIVYSSSAGAANTWSYANSPDSMGSMSRLSFVNGLFILSGGTSTFYTSTNATTWTQRSTQIVGYWNLWTYGAGKYASNDFGTKVATTSTDLTTWVGTSYSGAVLPDASNGYDWNGSYSGTTAILHATNLYYSYYSTDGTTWGKAYTGSAISQSAYGNGVFVGVIPGYYYSVVSTDGSYWQTYSGVQMYTVTFSNGKFYGTNNGPYGSSNPTAYVSTDGITWTGHYIGNYGYGSVMIASST